MTPNIQPGIIIAGSTLMMAVMVSCLPRPQHPEHQVPTISWIPDMPNNCKLQERTNEVCQRCAAKSKSTIVFPMCCQGREEAWEWCNAYIDFGFQERHLLDDHEDSLRTGRASYGRYY